MRKSADVRLAIITYHRRFDLPGAPVVWAVEVSHAVQVGNKTLAPQIVTITETDEKLNALAFELREHADGKPAKDTAEARAKRKQDAVWDEATLVEATRRVLELDASVPVDVATPPTGE